jgi:hypothetical protein
VIYAVLIILLIVGSWSLLIVMKPQGNMAGRAFYFTREGDLSITEPGQRIPPDVQRINLKTWGAFLAVMFTLLGVVSWAERIKHRHRRKRKQQ